VDSLAGKARCRRRGSVRSANCRRDVGERRSTHLNLQLWGFSSLCGINCGDAHLPGWYNGGDKKRYLTPFFLSGGFLCRVTRPTHARCRRASGSFSFVFYRYILFTSHAER
jgi:hypothetical protein